ncbi:hypothetical protein EVAR_83264_1 [Eumeta japonica]|uniref:Uncharacterized protein n=1 Tax=Eumeta variegata TaxID=151549 RepID=A0A4C1XBL9_EUMVA|nr:hypothetical protein EVAR_83264_1 [Eumeta japonica]
MGQVKADGIESLRPWSEDDAANNKRLRRVLSGSAGALSPMGSPGAAALPPRRLSQPEHSPASSLVSCARTRQLRLLFLTISNRRKGGWRTHVSRPHAGPPPPPPPRALRAE